MTAIDILIKYVYDIPDCTAYIDEKPYCDKCKHKVSCDMIAIAYTAAIMKGEL